MLEPAPQELVYLLASKELKMRTGILELPLDLLGTENNLAVERGVWISRIFVLGRSVGLRSICST